MDTRWALVRLLADGRLHSGAALGRALGISRTAVWKAVRALGEAGLEVEAVAGRGYRLARPLELLDRRRILEAMGEAAQARLHALEVLPETDSTNRRLAALGREGAPAGTACVAEWQRAGRGRRGRTWSSPFGAGLWLSLLWRYEEGPGALQGLSLAAGVVAAEAVREASGVAVTLKWPNDLLVGGRKVGGILVELEGEAAGPSRVVVGVGINVRLPAAAASGIDQPWTDLAGEMDGPVGRNALAGRLLAGLLEVLPAFPQRGFACWRPAWERLDALRGRAVVVHAGGGGAVAGIADGVDDDGALRLRTDAGVRRFHGGEVSVRTAA